MLFRSFIIIATASIAQGLAPPACQDVAPAQKNLTDVMTAQYIVDASPFGIVYATKQQDVAFVAQSGGPGKSSLGIMNTTTWPPSLQHQIAIPAEDVATEGAFGVALTHDGEHLIVAASYGAVIFDTSKAALGSDDAIIGTLNGTTKSQRAGASAIEVTISPDDKYAFISQEYGVGETAGNLDVFKLEGGSGTPVGFLTLDYDVVGTALSPDGKTLYAASEQTAPDSQQGIINVIDVATLEQTPEKAVRGNASAGCNPVRTLVSSDGKTLWATARASNMLLGYDTSKLVSDPDNALIASVQVGTSPVGLTFAKNETLILTADSNRFHRANATTGLTVVDVQAALKGQSAVLGSIPTGQFPREFATSPDGQTILVSDFASKQVQAIEVKTLPSAAGQPSTSAASVFRGSPAFVSCMAFAMAHFLG